MGFQDGKWMKVTQSCVLWQAFYYTRWNFGNYYQRFSYKMCFRMGGGWKWLRIMFYDGPL